MSIKFVCSCGKHLRARDEMAARRSMCPRCGKPVGVPSMRPTHSGTVAAPMTPGERLRLNRLKPGGTNDPEGITTVQHPSQTLPDRLLSSPDNLPRRKLKVRRRRQLEQCWYQCLIYPLLNVKVFFCFALLLATGITGLVLIVQNLPPFSDPFEQHWAMWFSLAALVGILVPCAYASVECALASALAGQGPAPCWPTMRDFFPLKSAQRLVLGFFAGPIVPVCIAGYLWLYCGDLKTLDYAILAELGVFTVAYWFLAIVSAHERNRLLDANPMRVALLIHRLSYRAFVPVVMAPALIIPHVLFGFVALTILHQQPFGGWLLLMASCGSSLFWAAFLFRLMGVWCFYLTPTESDA